jgi:ligand-binding sensor domain-containing protein
VLEDHAGNMWLGTEGEGLYRVKQERETVFRAPASLPDNSITALLEDREQNLWVGTADGLVRLSAPGVAVLNSRGGLSNDNIITVYCGNRSTL